MGSDEWNCDRKEKNENNYDEEEGEKIEILIIVI